MIDYEKFINALKRYFPRDREKIEQISKASSNRKQLLINFLGDKISEAKKGVSTRRTRANITLLRSLRREIEKDNRSKLITWTSNLVEQAAKILMARQTTEGIVNVAAEIVEKVASNAGFSITISPEIRKGVSCVLYWGAVKPIGKVVKWHKDTVCEMYDAARETWREIKKENPSAGLLKTGLAAADAAIKSGAERIDDALTKFDSDVSKMINRGKEVGKRIIEKANDSLEKICSSAVQWGKKTFESTSKKVKNFFREIF